MCREKQYEVYEGKFSTVSTDRRSAPAQAAVSTLGRQQTAGSLTRNQVRHRTIRQRYLPREEISFRSSGPECLALGQVHRVIGHVTDVVHTANPRTVPSGTKKIIPRAGVPKMVTAFSHTMALQSVWSTHTSMLRFSSSEKVGKIKPNFVMAESLS